uniref:Uncharacterized protein n=1 Tax=Arundo donax TaxID=35708 RepID=A0A0A9AXJ5_ARUDO
MPVVCIWLVVS